MKVGTAGWRTVRVAGYTPATQLLDWRAARLGPTTGRTAAPVSQRPAPAPAPAPAPTPALPVGGKRPAPFGDANKPPGKRAAPPPNEVIDLCDSD